MKRISILATLAVSMSLGLGFGCKGDDSDEVVVAPAPPSPTLTDPVLSNPTVEVKLVGNSFETPCLPETLLDMTSRNSIIAFQDSGTFQKSYSFFLGDSCGVEPYMTLETSGTFSDEGPTSADPKISNIDFVVNDSLLTIRNQSLVTTFNVNAYCGKSDWKLDEKVSLTDVNCEFFSNTFGIAIADVYSIEEGVVFFGNALSHSAQTGLARPTGVERDISYRVLAP